MQSVTDQSCWDLRGPFPMSFANSPKRTCRPHSGNLDNRHVEIVCAASARVNVSVLYQFVDTGDRPWPTTSVTPRQAGAPIHRSVELGRCETPVSHREESTHMNRKSFLVGLLAADCFVATSTLMTSPGNAQADPKVAKALAILKAETAKLGAPKVEGTDQTADKTTPGLYFGSTKVNNDFTIVDKVKAEAGGTATLFVKSGDDYVRVSTNVPGSVHGRAIGTILDPKGKAIANINKGEAFYGEVDILGKPYVTGYDPIKDASGKVIGIWYVGYEK